MLMMYFRSYSSDMIFYLYILASAPNWLYFWTWAIGGLCIPIWPCAKEGYVDPLRSDKNFMKDAHSAESNEKSDFYLSSYREN